MLKVIPALALLSLAVASTPGYACIPKMKSTIEYYDQADVVFVGTHVATTSQRWSDVQERAGGSGVVPGQLPLIHELEVTELFKANTSSSSPIEVGAVVYLMQDASSCGLSINSNRQYLIFGTEVFNDTFTTGLTFGSNPLELTGEMVPDLRRVAKP